MAGKIKIRTTYTNNMTALHTAEITEGWFMVESWLRDQGVDPADVVRKYRVNKRGNVTFKHGFGYAILDADLFGGDGDGTTERRFRDAYPHVRIEYP